MLLEEPRVYLRRLAWLSGIALFNLQPLLFFLGLAEVASPVRSEVLVVLWLVVFFVFELVVMLEVVIGYAAHQSAELRSSLEGTWKRRASLVAWYIATSLLTLFGNVVTIAVCGIILMILIFALAKSMVHDLRKLQDARQMTEPAA